MNSSTVGLKENKNVTLILGLVLFLKQPTAADAIMQSTNEDTTKSICQLVHTVTQHARKISHNQY